MTAFAVGLDTLQRAALDFANALRAEDGREPVPALVMGTPYSCAGCPIAATANMGTRRDYPQWEVGAVAVKISASGKPTRGRAQVPVPPKVPEFMAAFDSGMYPDLIAGQA